MKNKQFYSVTYRLFCDDEPVGFENWCQGSLSYTHGDPSRRDGCYTASEGSGIPGWCGKPISHNRKEIINIGYVTPKYIAEQAKLKAFWTQHFDFMNKMLPVINFLREDAGREPLTKIGT